MFPPKLSSHTQPVAAKSDFGGADRTAYSDEKNANRDIIGLARRDRKWLLNDGQIQNPSNPFGIVPPSNFVPRGFGFVHHSIAILYHEVPNLSITIRNFLHRCMQVGAAEGGGAATTEAAERVSLTPRWRANNNW
jgi:hypothetical protein